MKSENIETIEALQGALNSHGYIADKGLATALFIAMKLPQPLLLEGLSRLSLTNTSFTLE